MSDTYESRRMRQLVDWSSAIWAGLIGGVAFLLVNVLVSPLTVGGNAWVYLRLLASPILGPEILAPPATFDATALAVALVTNFALAIVFALVVAFILHRWGLLVGIFGGAVLGLCLYLINLYSLTLLFPWFWAMNSSMMVASHVLFGAIVGGVYEALEVEIFVPDDATGEV